MSNTLSQENTVSGPDVAADARALRLYVEQHDERAFAEIVRRHGPMVLGVCRRILANSEDADDAFQAVFIVLARRAGAVDPPELLGHWLYGVAYRTASKARSMKATRGRKEREAVVMSEHEMANPAAIREIQEVVDEEIHRLPRTYREPVVACHLRGLSRADAAKALQLNEGTLSSRLARGREMLATSLARRGFAPTAIAVAITLLAQSAEAKMPAALLASTLSAAKGAATVTATSSASATLADTVIKAMAWAKVKLAAMIVTGVVVIGGGAITWRQLTKPEKPVPTNSVEQAKPTPTPTPGNVPVRRPDYTGTP